MNKIKILIQNFLLKKEERKARFKKAVLLSHYINGIGLNSQLRNIDRNANATWK